MCWFARRRAAEDPVCRGVYEAAAADLEALIALATAAGDCGDATAAPRRAASRLTPLQRERRLARGRGADAPYDVEAPDAARHLAQALARQTAAPDGGR